MNDFNTELTKLRELTGRLTKNGYLIDRAEQWEFALDAIPDLVFIVNQRYKIKYINKALSTKLNIKKSNVVDKNCCDLFADENTICLCRKTFSTSSLLNYDFEHYKPFKQTVNLGDIYIEKGLNGWFNFSRSSIFDDDGVLLGFICVLRDINERKKMEDLVQVERERLVSIFDSIDEVIYLVDPDTYELLYMNDPARKNWGGSVGEKCYEVLQNCDAPCQFCTNDKIFGKNLGKTYIYEYQNEINGRWYKCIDKAIKWPVFSGDCKWVRYEMAIDIHDFKENQLLMKSIFKASPAGIGLSVDRVIKWSNAKLREITGYSDEELTNVDARMLYSDDEMYERVGKERLKQIEKTGTGSIKTIWKKKDGELIKVLLGSSPIDPSDWAKGFIFTAINIVDYKE